MRIFTVLGAISLITIGCGTGSPPEGTVALRDSAGIQIVESSAPTGVASAWSLSPSPVLSIGERDGADEYLLFRVYSGSVLSGGEILASNSGTQELRLYSAEGDFLRAFGGNGEGPGEFNGFSNMRVYRWGADSVAVTDDMALRVNLFGDGGGFGRSVSPAVVEGFGRPAIWGVFSDKRWLAEMPEGTGMIDGNVGERIDMDFGFFAFDAEGRSAIQLAIAPGRPRIVNSLGGGRRDFPYVPLTQNPVFSVAGEDLLLSRGQEPELSRVDPKGAVRSIFRWSPPRTGVTEIWQRFKEAYLADAEEDRRPAYSRLLETAGLPIPEEVPAVGGIQVDLMGFVWVQRYRLPWESQPLWDVLDSEGIWIGSVETPPNVRVLEIGEDYILGRHLDDLGVERLVLYSLNRSE